MFDTDLHRRQFLVLAGTAATVGLAGCTTGYAGEPPAGGMHDDAEHDDGMHDDGMHDDEDDGHGHDEMVGDPVAVAEVTMASTSEGEHFEPHVVRVTTGGTVRWTLESGTHSTTAYSSANGKHQLMPDGAASWDSGILTDAGAVFEHTFETEGVYHYYCTPHETLGMIGSVIVGEPDVHGQPALEEPPADMPDRVREKLAELDAMCTEALGHSD